jgi:hypothetical protein
VGLITRVTAYPLSIGRTLGCPLVTSSCLGWDIQDVGGELVGQLVHKYSEIYELFLLHQCASCVIPIHQKGIHDSNSDDVTIYSVPPALGVPILVDGKAPLSQMVVDVDGREVFVKPTDHFGAGYGPPSRHRIVLLAILTDLLGPARPLERFPRQGGPHIGHKTYISPCSPSTQKRRQGILGPVRGVPCEPGRAEAPSCTQYARPYACPSRRKALCRPTAPGAPWGSGCRPASRS